MAYASQRDRNPHDLELENPAFPVPPLNLFLTSGYQPGVFDLCWDDPAYMTANAKFIILGVNVYRSFDSEFGPYYRLTEMPVGARFYRDRTNNVVVFDELVEDSQWVLRGECTGSEMYAPRFVFRTLYSPIVVSGSQALPEENVNEVRVSIDGARARLKRVVGETGEIEIETRQFPDVATQTLDPSPVPGDTSVVKVTYRYNKSLVRTDLSTRVFYRVTTIGVPVRADLDVIRQEDIVETPLARAATTSSRELEKIDWIWREAVRRNQWILQEGGERVLVYLQKTVGETCPCVQNYTHKQPLNDCQKCYGVGILRGYEGPYPIVVAPDDAERRINQTARGMNIEHVMDVWTGPAPLLSQRDFIVRINGERFSVGAVRMPTNRGMILQQHFNLGWIDEKDIRFKVPIDNVQGLAAEQLLPPALAPVVETAKPNIPDERELRGRTKTWENLVYVLPFFFVLRCLIDVTAFSGSM
jgi:hypothetical protein